MFEKWKINQPFKNRKKAVVGFIVIILFQSVFAQRDYGLELAFKDGLPSNVTRKTHIDPEGTIWVGTDAGLGLFPNFNRSKVSITKQVGFSQVWDIHQQNDLIYFATYDSGLYVFNYINGKLLKRYTFREIPKIRKFKTIENETFIVSHTGFFKISGIEIIKILGRHPFARDTNSFGMDIFKWKNKLHVSYFRDEKLLELDQNKWVICNDELGQKIQVGPQKFKTVMCSYYFNGKLICSTGDSKFFTIDENNQIKHYNFTDKIGSNYVIWDIKQSENHIYFAVGNTENFEKGLLFEFIENETPKEVSMLDKHYFLWSITVDPRKRGLWANTINHGVFFYPNYDNHLSIPKNFQEYFETKNYDFGWDNNDLFFKLKNQTNWNYFSHTNNIRNVLEYHGKVIIFSEDGVYLMTDIKTKTTIKIFSRTFQNVFIQNDILYAVNYFGPIWSYSLSQNKVINHLSQKIKNFNSIVSNEHHTILHNDNHGYFMLIHDSLIPLSLNLPIAQSNYTFYVSGKLIFIQSGNDLFCCEIDEIQHKINSKCKINLKQLFPFFNIEWIKGTNQGLWLGNSKFALQTAVNVKSSRFTILRQFYLGNANEISNVYISNHHISIIRNHFIQKIPINTISQNLSKFKINYLSKSSQSSFTFPFISQGQNFNIGIESPDYLQHKNCIYEINLATANHFIFQKFYTSDNGIWLNDLSRDLYQIKISCLNTVNSFPLMVNNSLVKRLEFWIYIFATMSILFFILYNQQRRSYELQEKNLSLELSTLKSNFNPHFIFNVMNFVQAMIVKSDQKKALKATSELAHLNRLFLETSNQEIINLKQELNLARKYINLEKLRFEEDKTFEFLISIEKTIVPEEWFLPPLLMQPLLENAVKHGVLLLEKAPGKIKIIILQIAPNEIDIIVQNIGLTKNFKRIGGTGLGQKLVAERIQLYNRKFANEYFATFSSNFDGDLYNSHITILKKMN